MKPLALVERAIENSSQAGDVVLDLFLGSGSTLIACRAHRPRLLRDGARPALRVRRGRSLGSVHRRDGEEAGRMTAITATQVHTTTAYAQAVVGGDQIASRLLRLACARHLQDLDTGGERGLWFDERAASDAISFFSFLQLAEGQYAGEPFVLQPWQQFIVGCLFGWKGSDGYRRFRTAYIEVAKGNGKCLAAGIALHALQPMARRVPRSTAPPSPRSRPTSASATPSSCRKLHGP